MQFTIHQPPPLLADSVKAIWVARGSREEFAAPEPIVPDGCVEVIFNVGGRFVDARTGELQPRVLLAGQMTRPVIALPTGAVDLIGVRFHTGRAGAALAMPMSTLQDRLIDAGTVSPGFVRLADNLGNLPCPQRLEHLSAALATLLRPVDSGTLSAVDQALAMIDGLHGSVSIEMVAKRIGVTRRQLERQFREHVGLRAKHVARIVRIHTVLEMLRRQPDLSGAEIAASCGYSDQAHLIRECQELAGQTPQRLKTTTRSLARAIRGRGPRVPRPVTSPAGGADRSR